MANKNRDPKREAFWRRAVARQRNGGHSIRAFCRSQRLSEPSFYAWRREIARRDKEERPGRTSSSFNPLDGGPGLNFSANGGEIEFGFGFAHSTAVAITATDIEFANFTVTPRTVKPADVGVAVVHIDPAVELHYRYPGTASWQIAQSASIRGALVFLPGTEVQVLPRSAAQSAIGSAFTYTPVSTASGTPTGPVDLTQNTCEWKATGRYQPVDVTYVADASDPHNADSDSVHFKPHQIYTRPISVETKTGTWNLHRIQVDLYAFATRTVPFLPSISNVWARAIRGKNWDSPLGAIGSCRPVRWPAPSRRD